MPSAATAQPAEFWNGADTLPMEAFRDNREILENAAAGTEVPAVALGTSRELTSLLDKLLVLLMIAVLLTLSLPAVCTFVRWRQASESITVRDPIIRLRKLASEQEENIVEGRSAFAACASLPG